MVANQSTVTKKSYNKMAPYGVIILNVDIASLHIGTRLEPFQHVGNITLALLTSRFSSKTFHLFGGSYLLTMIM